MNAHLKMNCGLPEIVELPWQHHYHHHAHAQLRAKVTEKLAVAIHLVDLHGHVELVWLFGIFCCGAFETHAHQVLPEGQLSELRTLHVHHCSTNGQGSEVRV